MREIRLSGSEGGETAIKAVFPTPIKRLGGGRLARFVVVAGRKTTCRKVFTPNTQLSLRYFPFPIKTGTPGTPTTVPPKFRRTGIAAISVTTELIISKILILPVGSLKYIKIVMTTATSHVPL